MRLRVRVVAAACAGLLLAACAGTSDPPAGTASPALVVTPAPLLPGTVDALPTMNVDAFHELLGQLRGTPVVVNVWASWCGPCEREAPLLSAASREHRDVQFLGVDIQDSREGAEAFIAEHGLPYPSVFDPSAAIRTDLGSIGQPVTAFYDARGTQVEKWDGEIGGDTLERYLGEIAG